MVTRITPCDPTLLASLLEDSLDERQEGTAMQHLESCVHCQRALESLAAEETWWRDASRLQQLPSPHTLAAPSAPAAASSAAEDGEELSDREYVQYYLEPADDPAILGRLNEYDVLDVIGRGGMGLVVRAYDKPLSRYVAIKILSPALASSGAARKRFAREAQAAAAVVHWHVVAIHAVNGSGRLPYLVMSYVPGESLQKRLDRLGPLELRDILRIGMQAARGLSAAHEQGLVHRDVKPANILLERDVDRVLLTDFGLARAVDDASLTLSGVIAGTPQYMSPEQAKGEGIDTRADLFGLGAVLYTMATGRAPFRAETTMGILHRICNADPHPIRDLNPDIPPWLAGIIDRLLAKRPDDRYQSASELADLLGQCLAHVQHPSSHRLPDSLRQEQQPGKRARSRAWFTIAAFALMAAIAVLKGWQQAGQSSEGQGEAVVSTPAPVTNHEWVWDGQEQFAELQQSLDQMSQSLQLDSRSAPSAVDHPTYTPRQLESTRPR